MDDVKQSRHRVTLALVVLYFVVLAAMVFWPSPVDRPIDGALTKSIGWLYHLGVPRWFIGYRKIEFAANILLFIPFGVIVAARQPRSRWWVAVAAAALISSAIEISQGLFLPERVAAWSDVISNTTGALAGALLVVILRAAFRRSARARQA